jgi:hypothetical protein
LPFVKYDATYVWPAVTGTGVENCTVCQPDAVSLTKFAEASNAPVADHRCPVWVPVLVVPL